ncbi:hypothetical protein FH972_022394 [Carpinus fangiana]|uniref:Cytochrome P450 n=1 Tax=Carpinus fangiana TaxID=176857 RepID=A0A5N6KST4_9ROSI|nr:hypothetical protein FH972_022394 [Carpinus fangiana]
MAVYDFPFTTPHGLPPLQAAITPFILLLACLLVLSYIVYQRFFSPLAGIPGPFWASVSRIWITKLSWHGGTHRVMVDLHAKHGKLVRIAPNELSIAEPSDIKKIYGAGTKFRKSDWYSVWQGRRKFDLFPERDEAVHSQQRRLVARHYSMDSLKQLETYVEDAIVFFFRRMEDVRLQGTVDLGKWVQLLAFDVIGEITFSKRFGFMDVGEDDGSFKQINRALRSASWVGQMPWLYWLHDWLSPIIGSHLAITARHGSLRSFAVREVEARKDRGSDREDILSKLFATHKEKPGELDMTAVMSMATSNIFAGSDTTATSMRAVIYYLLKHPQYKQKLVSEIDAARKDGSISDPIKMAEADKLPYLQAVIWEGLRKHPAVGMSLPRTVPAGGFEACGRYLPAGTVIGTNPWVLHRDRAVYGADADDFNPERWLSTDEARVSDMHRYLFTFGAGARMCIGKNIGWMEMSKLIPMLFLRYDVRLSRPDTEWTMTSWWFVMQSGVDVTLTPRNIGDKVY